MGEAPLRSNRWFCNVSRLPQPQRGAMVTGCCTRPQPPIPVPSALRYSRRAAAAGAGGAGGGIAPDGQPRARLPHTRSAGLTRRRDWPRGSWEPRGASARGRPRGRPLRRWPLLAVNSSVAAQGREQRRLGCGRPRGPTPGRTAERALDPTYRHPDGPGLGRGGRRAGARVIIMHSARSFRLQLFSLANL